MANNSGGGGDGGYGKFPGTNYVPWIDPEAQGRKPNLAVGAVSKTLPSKSIGTKTKS